MSRERVLERVEEVAPHLLRWTALWWEPPHRRAQVNELFYCMTRKCNWKGRREGKGKGHLLEKGWRSGRFECGEPLESFATAPSGYPKEIQQGVQHRLVITFHRPECQTMPTVWSIQVSESVIMYSLVHGRKRESPPGKMPHKTNQTTQLNRQPWSISTHLPRLKREGKIRVDRRTQELMTSPLIKHHQKLEQRSLTVTMAGCISMPMERIQAALQQPGGYSRCRAKQQHHPGLRSERVKWPTYYPRNHWGQVPRLLSIMIDNRTRHSDHVHVQIQQDSRPLTTNPKDRPSGINILRIP